MIPAYRGSKRLAQWYLREFTTSLHLIQFTSMCTSQSKFFVCDTITKFNIHNTKTLYTCYLHSSQKLACSECAISFLVSKDYFLAFFDHSLLFFFKRKRFSDTAIYSDPSASSSLYIEEHDFWVHGQPNQPASPRHFFSHVK